MLKNTTWVGLYKWFVLHIDSNTELGKMGTIIMWLKGLSKSQCIKKNPIKKSKNNLLFW